MKPKTSVPASIFLTIFTEGYGRKPREKVARRVNSS
jgi:hypothetical protein